MAMSVSNALVDDQGGIWRFITNGTHSVWQKSVPVPVPSDSKDNFEFATWGGLVPNEILERRNKLSSKDFSFSDETLPKPEFIFHSGRSTLQLQNARNLTLSTLKIWLQDINVALESFNNLTNVDCALVSGAFNRIEKALDYDHSIQVPYGLVHQKPEVRLAWLLSVL